MYLSSSVLFQTYSRILNHTMTGILVPRGNRNKRKQAKRDLASLEAKMDTKLADLKSLFKASIHNTDIISEKVFSKIRLAATPKKTHNSKYLYTKH